MSRISRDLAESAHNAYSNGSLSTVQSRRRAAGKAPSVAIIGAGFSGLRCADVLARSGVQVTMYEARDRIGGRVHQQQSGGYLMDMGPNWIHGTVGNPIMKLALGTGTVVMEPEEAGALFDSHGQRRADEEATELSSMVWEMVIDAFKYSDENSANINPQTSLYDYFKAQWQRKVQDKDRLDDLLKETQTWGPFVGDPVERQSLKFFFLEECIDGENVFVANTYQRILHQVGQTALGQADMHFNQEVVHFDLADSRSGPPVILTTAQGDQRGFDDVVVTCPLGWLKRHRQTAFTPSLPARLSQAIDNINYGRLEKLYVTFPSAFWMVESASSPDGSSFPVFAHFHDPSYIPHPSTEAWNQSLVSLAHLPAPCNHPTLLFYIYGPCATAVVQRVTGLEPHSAPYDAALTAFAEPFYRLLPNYSSTQPDCQPTSFLMTQWQNDPYAGHGSYCNFQIGLEKGDQDIEIMRDAGGLTEKGLWLAGEHTAPFIALGTTTGAWWSGEAVARRICAKYGLDVPAEAVTDDEMRRKDLVAGHADAANMNGLAI